MSTSSSSPSSPLAQSVPAIHHAPASLTRSASHDSGSANHVLASGGDGAAKPAEPTTPRAGQGLGRESKKERKEREKRERRDRKEKQRPAATASSSSSGTAAGAGADESHTTASSPGPASSKSSASSQHQRREGDLDQEPEGNRSTNSTSLLTRLFPFIAGGRARNRSSREDTVGTGNKHGPILATHLGLSRITRAMDEVRDGSPVLMLGAVPGLHSLHTEMFADLHVSVDEINLSWNRIQSFPSDLVSTEVFRGVKNLSFFGNQLAFLPSTFANLTSLTSLSLDANRLCAVPPCLAHLSNLTSLGLSWNSIFEFPGEIAARLVNLTLLDLTGNKLKALPPEITTLTKLVTLRLVHNRLESLPENFANLTSLTELQLADNCLEDLPPNLEEMKCLGHVDVHNNKLKHASFMGVFFIEPMNVVDVCQNKLSHLPKSWGSGSEDGITDSQLNVDGRKARKSVAKWLRILRLQQNRLSSLHSPIWLLLTSLRTLQLSYNCLTISSFPDDFGKSLNSLEQLFLQSNQLTTLPIGLRGLPKLRIADISRNKLESSEELFETLTSFPSLAELDMSSNALTYLPDTISRLTSLTVLAVADNQIEVLPESLSEMTGFRPTGPSFSQCQLLLSYNRLTEFPRCVLTLNGIQELSLSGNSIPTIPGEISALNRLQSFSLANNRSSEPVKLPASLAEITTLQRLYLRNSKISPDMPDFGDMDLVDITLTWSPEMDDVFTAHASRLHTTPTDDQVKSSLAQYGVSKIMGTRRKNEDTFDVKTSLDLPNQAITDYVAVFDGHGGEAASKFARERFHEVLTTMLKQSGPVHTKLRASFHHYNHELRYHLEESATSIEDQDRCLRVGSTSVVVLVQRDAIHVANAGDSRAIFCYRGVAKRLSVDHSIGEWDETNRVRALGGLVLADQLGGGAYRIHDSPHSGLSVSRSLGDFQLAPLVSADPYTHSYPLDELRAEIDRQLEQDELSASAAASTLSTASSADAYLVLACDGVWDVLSDQEAAKIVFSSGGDASTAAVRIQEFSSLFHSGDDICVVVVKLSPPPSTDDDDDLPAAATPWLSSTGSNSGPLRAGGQSSASVPSSSLVVVSPNSPNRSADHSA